MNKIALYRRVSTDHQDNSLELQEHRVSDYLQFKWPAAHESVIFSDPDTSGGTPMRDRDGGADLLRRLQFGDVKHLVVAKLDRLGRDVRDGLAVLEFLRERDITLHIVDLGGESISTQGHIGKLILTLMFAFAEWELGEIRDRTRKQMKRKFDLGDLTGHVPFGWDAFYKFTDGFLHQTGIAMDAAVIAKFIAEHGEVVSKKLRDNPREQQILRELESWTRVIVDDAGTRASHTQLATWANERGYVTKQGHAWGKGNVRSVLNNQHTKRLLAQPEPEPVTSDV
jgi:DNA invertase Pin-like site-specific DNA recombinase